MTDSKGHLTEHDLKKQSQFTPARTGAKSCMLRAYENTPRREPCENRAKQSQFPTATPALTWLAGMAPKRMAVQFNLPLFSLLRRVFPKALSTPLFLLDFSGKIGKIGDMLEFILIFCCVGFLLVALGLWLQEKGRTGRKGKRGKWRRSWSDSYKKADPSKFLIKHEGPQKPPQ
jgi:hypothetical protein